MKKLTTFFLLLLGLHSTVPLGDARAITLGQIDDFEDGTVLGWREGGPSPNDPFPVASGGPSGPGDGYLENRSSGFFGAGSRMVMFNTSSWSGDWNDEGIQKITAHMANFGATDLFMRIAIQGDGTGRYSSTDAVVLPADGLWREVTFGVSTSDLTLIGGASSLDQVLASVSILRILSARFGPNWVGDAVVGDLGVDNIRAVPPVEVDVTLDAQDGPILVSAGQVVVVGVELEPGRFLGVNADWFLIAQTPLGLFHYDRSQGWMPGIATTFEGPLFATLQSLDPIALPVGTHTILFGVDGIQDGVLDPANPLIFDSATVTVIR